eukprot:NODE_6390_length_576_cov_18.210626_g5977_i0.p2 GENE.NODE_6390_length_576_cov_18.210626_g5977_i0~~NODE_6390_length_576_cov_18.210626_g5977_i0.p2  ORF type:complete len:112 (+),score=12.23 NODE_6390_length_576_cov_18.210626_g5977_i0:193-528(+)
MFRTSSALHVGTRFWRLYQKINNRRHRELKLWREAQLKQQGSDFSSAQDWRQIEIQPRSIAFGWKPESQTFDPSQRWGPPSRQMAPEFTLRPYQGSKEYLYLFAKKPAHYS